jgi:general secretion pathway protein L
MRQQMEIDLSRPVTLRELPDLIASFLQWWGRELNALLPSRWRLVSGAGVKRPEYFVSLSANSSGASDYVVAANAESQVATDILTDRRVDISLDPALILRRTLTLPDLPVQQLRSAIRLQIDELTPFTAQDVMFDLRVVARDGASQKCAVDIAFLPIRVFTNVLAKLGLAAAAVKELAVKSSPAEPPHFRFALAPIPGRSRDTALRWTAVVAAAAAGLFAVSWSWSYAGEQERQGLKDRIALARPAAEAARQANNHLRALSAPLLAQSKERATDSPLYVLSALSKINPETVTVVKLDIENGHVQVSGLAKNASAYLDMLEKSREFEQASFSAPVNANQPDGRERFSIALKLSRVLE